MMDGLRFPREWSAERVRESLALGDERGVCIWLAHDKDTGELVGFCVFWVPPGGSEPELLYALRESWSGRGLATEMGRDRAGPHADRATCGWRPRPGARRSPRRRSRLRAGFPRCALPAAGEGDGCPPVSCCRWRGCRGVAACPRSGAPPSARTRPLPGEDRAAATRAC